MTCKDCPNRHVGCHSTCADYAAFRAEQDRINELKRKDLAERNVDIDMKMKNVLHSLKKKKNGRK